MKFEKYLPSAQLRPYVKYFVISENEIESEYKVFPTSGMVIGFQFKGKLSTIKNGNENLLSTAGITGITDSYRVFRNTSSTGTVLVYFNETAIHHFINCPANELFNESISLEELFDRSSIARVEDKLSEAGTDNEKLNVIEQFLLTQLKDLHTDELIVEAVNLIRKSKGIIRIEELNEKLFISKSPLEKRFRKVVGTTPKKFASIIRFNNLLSSLDHTKSLTKISYDFGFFDQAHFNKSFLHFTGETPRNFRSQQ